MFKIELQSYEFHDRITILKIKLYDRATIVRKIVFKGVLHEIVSWVLIKSLLQLLLKQAMISFQGMADKSL